MGTFYATKRLIGRKFDDEATRSYARHVPYRICSHTNGDAWVEDATGKRYSPSQIGAKILEKMKQSAEAFLECPVTDAVVTVPAYFDDAQRQATKDAGKIAGLNVQRVVNEPTAAAMAYGLGKKATTDGTRVGVYDLGGGTFDVSILELTGGVFEVRATNGDTALGGEDFDERIQEHIAAAFKKETGADVRTDKMALQRVREAAEKAKIELSTSASTEINLPYLISSPSGPLSLSLTLTRKQLDGLVEDLVARSIKPLERCLEDARLSKKELDEVILVGGMTRMPLVKQRVKEFFGKEPFEGVNPDESVALGASIQGSVLQGCVSDLVLLEVTPLSLGTNLASGETRVIIERNSRIPTTRTKTFTTVSDGQTSVFFKIVQGERVMADDNKLLGSFEITGLPPTPKGVPKFDVTFAIDANGIVNVSAVDKGTGKTVAVTVSTSGGLTPAEIERMQREAETYAELDARKKAFATMCNDADEQTHQAGKLRVSTHLDDDDKADLEAHVAAVAKAKAEGLDAVKRGAGGGAAAGGGGGDGGGSGGGGTEGEELRAALEALKQCNMKVRGGHRAGRGRQRRHTVRMSVITVFIHIIHNIIHHLHRACQRHHL